MNASRPEHADEAEDADDRVDQAGLQQLRQRFDVGGHAGHDPAGHLAVVVVDRHALEVGEDPDPQGVEEALGGTAGLARCRSTSPPSRRAPRPGTPSDAP